MALADFNPLKWLSDWRTAKKTKLEIAELQGKRADREREQLLTTKVSIDDIKRYDPKYSETECAIARSEPVSSSSRQVRPRSPLRDVSIILLAVSVLIALLVFLLHWGGYI